MFVQQVVLQLINDKVDSIVKSRISRVIFHGLHCHARRSQHSTS